ncbi:MAG TPA: hypothetical protein VF331_13430 [Polyangiales bacterium]
MLLLAALFSVIDKRAMQLLQTVARSCPVPASTIFYCLFTAGSALVCLPLALRRVGKRALLGELRGRGLLISACAVLT